MGCVIIVILSAFDFFEWNSAQMEARSCAIRIIDEKAATATPKELNQAGVSTESTFNSTWVQGCSFHILQVFLLQHIVQPHGKQNIE